MPGSKTTNTSESTSNPWQPAQGALKDVLAKAQSISADPSQFATTNTNAANALSSWAQSPTYTAQAANPVIAGSAQGYGTGLDQLTKTASGDGSYMNPYAKEALNFAMDQTADKVNAQFSGAGRYGSGAHTGTLTRELGGLAANQMTGLAEAERGRQLSASNTLLQGGYQGVNAAQAVDAEQAKRAQGAVQAAALVDQDANAARQAPMTALDWMKGYGTQIGAMGGQSSGTQTSSTPADKLGMAISAGKMIAGAATGNPMMMASGGSSLASGGGSSSNPWSWMGGYS